jgi:hypothetical protein
MKASYATLIGLVVAYSAYQGTNTAKSNNTQKGIAADDTSRTLNITSGLDASRPNELVRRTTALPTTPPAPSAGICRLSIQSGPSDPCPNCEGICPARGLRTLIEEHFRTRAEDKQDYLNAHWNVPRVAQQHIKFVIASLPDPVHTHMALLFDRGIQSLESAAQASGYLFSRAWMPWDISVHPESSDLTARGTQAQFRESLESLPGLMIFESASRGNSATVGGNDDNAPTTLFVFVVGETPTGGLRVGQFQNALNIRASILAGASPIPEESSVLRIYGPEFSGSLGSLNVLLNADHDRFSSILIRSGTVSSFRAMHDFCDATRKEWPDSGPDDKSLGDAAKGRPDFATFQFSDVYQEYYLSRFFWDRHHSHSHVAILSEDETAFGNQERSNTEQKPTSRPDPCGETPPDPVVPLLRLYFPREVAQLRNAYQQNLSLSTTAKNQMPQTGLALNFGATGNDDDSVAPYSASQTPLSQESILQAIVSTLRRKHAKVVVIRGTDPLDVVFLCRYLRQNYPQARLVTVGLDLLMIHDFYDPRFHGILGVAPYPLLNGADFPKAKSLIDDKQEVFRLFPDSYSVGGFNAFESLLAAKARETSVQQLPDADYAQFGLPSFLESRARGVEGWRAHLWLAAVGRDGYWPVAVLDDVAAMNKSKDLIPEPTIRPVNAAAEIQRLHSVHFSIGWTIFWTLAFGLTLLLTVVIGYPHVFSRSEILARFAATASRERNVLLLMAAGLVLAAQTLFVFPAVVWLGSFGQFREKFGNEEDWAISWMWVVMIFYVFSVSGLGLALSKRFRDTEAEFARYGRAICLTLAALAIVLMLAMWGGITSSRLGAFVYRYTNIGSGVSPLLPLLFLVAAWTWWCSQTLTGVASTEEKQIIIPDSSDFDGKAKTDDTPGTDRVEYASDRMRLKAIGSNGVQMLWAMLGIAPLGQKLKVAITAGVGLAVIYLLMRPSEIAEAFEVTAYKVSYWVLLYSCLLLVCYLVTHIVALWLEFRTFLRAVDRAPFSRGFSDLKSMTWKPLWKLAGNGRQEFVQLLGGEVDTLKQIKNCGISHEGLNEAINNAKDAANTVSSSYEKWIKDPSKSTAETQEAFHKLQQRLGSTASQALIYLNAQWNNEKYVLPATKEGKKESADKKGEVDNERQIDMPPAKDPCVSAVEHFLCLFYLNIILVPLRRLQTLILAIAGVFVFVLLSYSSYPFESRESFHVLLISIFFAISLVVGVVYGQMYTNPLLGRITNTKPGEFNLDFWVKLGSFVFIPLLSLVSVQFPEVNNFLFSWLEPALQSIK